MSALSEMYSFRVTLSMLRLSKNQLDAYTQRYASRLASSSHSFIIHLQTVLDAMIRLLERRPADLEKVNVVSTDGFIRRLGIEEVNLFELLRFVASKRIVYKLNGFLDRVDGVGVAGSVSGAVNTSNGNSVTYTTNASNGNNAIHTNNASNVINTTNTNNTNNATHTTNTTLTNHFPAVLDFIRSLTTDSQDSRVVVNYEREEPFVQLLLLNPAVYFHDVVSLCHAVIITGGTLQPVSFFGIDDVV